MVYAMLKRFGCQAAVGGIVPDDPADLEAALLRGVRQADMVVIGAGSSKGSKDFTMDVLEKLDTVVVQELGVTPGKHCSLTFIGGVPVLGIPGPPGGARLICQYYLRAAIDLLTAGCRRESMRVSARLTADVPGRWIDFMQPVRLFWADGILWAEPSASFGRTRAALLFTIDASCSAAHNSASRLVKNRLDLRTPFRSTSTRHLPSIFL